MIDKKLELFSEQAITNAAVLSTVLDLGSIENLGPGHQKFIEIYVDTAFTEDSSGEYLRLDLVASSGADPATTEQIMVIMKSTSVSSGSVLLSTGLLRKFAIPHKALDGLDHVAIVADVTSAVAAGKLTAYVTVD